MSRAHDLFRPNGMKLLLAATLVVPVFFGYVVVNGFPYSGLLVPAAVTVVISYAAAAIIDSAIQSRTAKIAVASIAALVSIVLGSFLVRSMTLVCDPVHDPGLICDPVHVPDTTPVPTVITPAIPPGTTPMIFDPVHEPGGTGPGFGTVPGVATGIVAEKLDECLRDSGR